MPYGPAGSASAIPTPPTSCSTSPAWNRRPGSGRASCSHDPTSRGNRATTSALQEGPSALRHGDDLFIVYSTRGSWSRHYKLGQLRLRTPDSDPLNPASWIKSGPIFTGNDRIHGVGHASFTTSPDGNEYWIYYHSKKDTVHNWGRDVRLQRFDFDATGNPRFGEPAEPGPYPMPSGTPKHAN